ncbi:carboxypeptidase-like protein [Xanthomonas bromi]|uniref:Carboxypeptidase-like protein n=1 Tax=Xanthomonas bromi TaxID=56449 RepID=A0A1C3NKE0_9XANT|nr:peptidase S10 [Xanthomonas bromi]PPV07639.1 peptidase S10 [Xanthomonas bromi]SBV50856.1 carboxypeptidase-like protein [Xanthomonas bromi]
MSQRNAGSAQRTLLLLLGVLLGVPPGAGAQQRVAAVAGNTTYIDRIAYASKADAGLDAGVANERSALMHHVWQGKGQTLPYSVRTGHLIARDAAGQPQATMSYVAYTAAARGGKPRPLTFFYNGGPGASASLLHLASFAPKRLATAAPAFGNWPNYPMVDNAESLIASTDMVFIDPPGTGLSEAILPNTNASFWSSDADVQVMRDFIQRYLQANRRSGAPLYLYGESYGTARSTMLALALESAGVRLTGIILQSSILNYYADALFSGGLYYPDYPKGMKYSGDTIGGEFPSYAAVAAYHKQTEVTASDEFYALQMRAFVSVVHDEFQRYGQAWVLSQYGFPNILGKPVVPEARVLTRWRPLSGLSMQALQGYFSLQSFNKGLLPGTTIGRYDGRVTLPNGDARLKTDNDPSDILIGQPLSNALALQFPHYLGYSAPNASYASFNQDIVNVWNFHHAGRLAPDTLPDLLGALRLNPALKVLALSGYHDLATPFYSTEKQLARLRTIRNFNPDVLVATYAGGHMIYLDDASRAKMQTDLTGYYANGTIQDAVPLALLDSPWPDLRNIGAAPATTAATP